MAYTDINTEDRLVQATFAEHLQRELGWETVYAWNNETFGDNGTLARWAAATLAKWCLRATCGGRSSG